MAEIEAAYEADPPPEGMGLEEGSVDIDLDEVSIASSRSSLIEEVSSQIFTRMGPSSIVGESVLEVDRLRLAYPFNTIAP